MAEAGRGSGPPEACSGGDRVALADGQATSFPHVGEPVEQVTHTVRLGESIASIALRYGMRREQLTLTLALALTLTLTLTLT